MSDENISAKCRDAPLVVESLLESSVASRTHSFFGEMQYNRALGQFEARRSIAGETYSISITAAVDQDLTPAEEAFAGHGIEVFLNEAGEVTHTTLVG